MQGPTVGVQVFRRRRGYHGYTGFRISGLREWDRQASFLLATSYSRRASPSRASQGLIQMDCVAVAWAGNSIYAAANSHALEDEDFIALAEELNTELTYYNIQRGDGGMHAEMQVVEELYEQGELQDGSVQYIGVSKPCCRDCAEFLESVDIEYSQWHGDYVVNWEAPDLS